MAAGSGTTHLQTSGINLDVKGGLNFRTGGSVNAVGSETGASINSTSTGGINYSSGSNIHHFTGGASGKSAEFDYAVMVGKLNSGMVLQAGSSGKGIYIDGSNISLQGSANVRLHNSSYPNAYIEVSDQGNPVIRGISTYLRTNTLYVHDGSDYNNTGYNGTIYVATSSGGSPTKMLKVLRGIIVE